MDREKIIKALEDFKQNRICLPHLIPWAEISDAIDLLKEQEETINDLTDTIRQLNQHIKDLSEYMTPYGKVKDVKAYAELLKEQETIEGTIEETRYEWPDETLPVSRNKEREYPCDHSRRNKA